jgi:Ureidoglycolate hydrolase
MSESQTVIKCIPISRAGYEAYGDLICADEALKFKPANMGTAKRFNYLSNVENLRQGTRDQLPAKTEARLNLCVFRVEPARMPLEIKLLERHEFSTQVFLPMSETSKFLVIVSLGSSAPDLDSLRAFVVEGAQGISYKPGVWHYPMTALDNRIDFACLVWEDGTKDDCELSHFSDAIRIEL